MVREWQADTVVLVARKMPRICSALGLDFGDAHIISDMSIPVASSLLENHRVAIVDDFVNAGSTIDRVTNLVSQCSPREIARFAIAARSQASIDKQSSNFVYEDALDTSAYQEIVSVLPNVFDTAAEAYDLEFPHITCAYGLEIPSFEMLAELLRYQFGSQAVQRVPGTVRSHGKLSLMLPLESEDSLQKIRFYGAPSGFIVVPICVPQTFGCRDVLPVLTRAFNDVFGAEQIPQALKTVADSDVLYRLELFLRSLNTYHRLCSSWAPLQTTVCSESLFDVQQASLAFGPAITRFTAIQTLIETSKDAELGKGSMRVSPSPFSGSAICERILDEVRHLDLSSPKQILNAIFQTLSEVVCSESPGSYELQWPYTANEIRTEPYKRLRIGPTFADLVAIVLDLNSGISETDAKREVSHYLDAAIDVGVVVPTIGKMDGFHYRVYRKGESNPTDRAIDVLTVGMKDCIKKNLNPPIPYSRTHVSKLVATLAFSGAVPSYFSVKAEDRGTVAVTQSSVISDGGEEVGRILLSRLDEE